MFFEIITQQANWALDMYNGLSQVYCFKPKIRIHWYTNGYGIKVLSYSSDLDINVTDS